MGRLTRRSVLRAGAAFAITTTIAGCAGDTDSTPSASGDIPGVEDGEVVDKHAFANAHSDRLATRSGTLEWARMSLDRETGDPDIHTTYTVRVDGARVHADVSGRSRFAESGDDRLEFYYEDDTTFHRTRTDGEWETKSVERLAVSEGDFTAESTLEMVSMSEVGTETVDGEELHRFSNAERPPEDDQGKWFSIQALVDDDGLVHSFQQTLDGATRNTRRFDEWYVTGLDETDVERPDWVEEADR